MAYISNGTTLIDANSNFTVNFMYAKITGWINHVQGSLNRICIGWINQCDGNDCDVTEFSIRITIYYGD